MTLFTPEQLKQTLHQTLSVSSLSNYSRCALLDYPDHPNIGDHLIWLGTVHYLTDVLKIEIGYASSFNNFSSVEMENQVGNAPIFFHGGGNLGDLWQGYQEFRERIIAQYPDRPIIIFPQSIYFENPDNLERASKIFNSHPNLTIFLRDDRSYQIACQVFEKCHVFKTTDMAFQLINMPGISDNTPTKSSSILYLCRKDKEINQDINLDKVSISNLVVEDWISFKSPTWFDSTRSFREKEEIVFRKDYYRNIKNLTTYLYQKYIQIFYSKEVIFPQIYNPSIYYYSSWILTYRGIQQFRTHNLVITNRLHAHILCIILGIPNILLPNSYYKNQSFYQTWTSKLSFSRLIENPLEIPATVQELLER
jgi:exopolysaccharide biosynthesis predicted pyruvyltransferase EpsI